MNPDPSNTVFQKAVAFVSQTSKHLFITGKAGTGKTTFLKYIKENSFKRMAVIAPTGVAAINAGGVTIHSFFQLPFGAFIPTTQHDWAGYHGEVNNPVTLLKNQRMPAGKRNVIRELDLLVIDEVSMVRADLLDAVDTVMRHISRQPLLPFGGVQVVYIGDLYQLPPVVNNEEWEHLKAYYRSPFFFDARVIKQAFPLYIELKKIYRQSDNLFINILNNIRNNCCKDADLEQLHQYYRPGYQPPKTENYITLTSHNAKADAINQAGLQSLDTKLFSYSAGIKGEFHEKSYPVEKTLNLKVGAQVMFIKNDKGEARKFYNGKIATVSYLSSETVKVAFAGEADELEVEKETWKNIRYQYNQTDDEIDEEELGTFNQYPLRLAWAITIHKSQGLTFDKAIVDAGASFAAGQVYVSLSRLTSLEGLILYSRILPQAVTTDIRVIDFVRHEKDERELEKLLATEQAAFAQISMLNGFAFDKLADVAEQHFSGYEARKIPNKNACIEWGKALLEQVKMLEEVAIKFKVQVSQLSGLEAGDQKINERIKAATAYFIKEIDEKLLSSVKEHIADVNTKEKTKRYLRDLKTLVAAFEHKKHQVNQTLHLSNAVAAKAPLSEVLQAVKEQHTPADNIGQKAKRPREKKVAGETQRLTLEMYKQNKSITAIADERGLAVSTIEGHLASFVLSGEINISELIDNDDLELVIKAIDSMPPAEGSGVASTSVLKGKLPEHITYGQIRAAMNFIKLQDASAQATR